jgi:hypothetical protein
MIRALITAIVEYSLVLITLKKGKFEPRIFALILFFLASYQLGEVVVFATKGSYFGFKIAYFSTTLLPPLGVLVLEKITRKRFFYVIFQVIGIFYAINFLVRPSFIYEFEITKYCIKTSWYPSLIIKSWSFYYILTLLYVMIFTFVNLVFEKNKNKKITLILLFLAYCTFGVVSVVYVNVFMEYKSALASIMCALAVFAAIIFTWISLKTKINKLQ